MAGSTQEEAGGAIGTAGVASAAVCADQAPEGSPRARAHVEEGALGVRQISGRAGEFLLLAASLELAG